MDCPIIHQTSPAAVRIDFPCLTCEKVHLKCRPKQHCEVKMRVKKRDSGERRIWVT